MIIVLNFDLNNLKPGQPKQEILDCTRVRINVQWPVPKFYTLHWRLDR